MDLPVDNQFSVSYYLFHTGSLFALGGSLFGLIPAIAAVLAVIWYGLEIYENKTVQRWLTGRRIRRIAKLKAQLLKLEKMPVKSIPQD